MSVHNYYKTFSSPSPLADVFKKASRHSRRISILKFFLPIAALAAALTFCWFTFFLLPLLLNL